VTTRERCAVCDFPLATDGDWRRAVQQGHTSDLAVYEGHLCWSVLVSHTLHAGPAIDWRARALEAEKEREGMRERARHAEAQRDEAVSLAHESLEESVRAKRSAHFAEARVEALEGALRKYGRHQSQCDVGNTGCDCGLSDALSTTPPKPTPEVVQCSMCQRGQPCGALPAPRPDAMAELEEARSEIIKLRVKNKFLREKVGYFRDDIESAAAGRDGCTGVFASPGSGSTPEAASLGAEHRPDATEALRVAVEALERLRGREVVVARCDTTEVEDVVPDADEAARIIDTALEMLRAHVEPTPLETAVLAHTEETP